LIILRHIKRKWNKTGSDLCSLPCYISLVFSSIILLNIGKVVDNVEKVVYSIYTADKLGTPIGQTRVIRTDKWSYQIIDIISYSINTQIKVMLHNI